MGKINLTSVSGKLRSLLSDKKLTAILLLVIVVSRVLQLLYLFNTRNDMSYQVLAGQAFYNGHGISASTIFPNDLSTVHYSPLVQWPPGFSILFVPFYKIFGEDYLAAAIAINLLAAIALIFFSRGILKLLNTPLYLINLFTVLTGFSVYYFYLKPCTDSVAISLFIMAVYFAISLAKSTKRTAWKLLAIAITLLFCAFIKYLYLPVVFLIPLLLFAEGFFKKKGYLKRSGLILFGILLFACASFLIYQKLSSDTVGYIKESKRGFYPENLLSAHAYIPSTFIKPETVEWFFNWNAKTTAITVTIFQFIHLGIFIFLLGYFLKQVSHKDAFALSSFKGFFILFVLTSLAITALLSWLSLRVAKEFVYEGFLWTYVQEPRYYGTIQVCLHVLVFAAFSFYRKTVRVRYAFYFLVLLLLPEMFRGVIFTANRLGNLSKEEFGWQREKKFQQFATGVIEREKKKQNAEQVVLTGSSDWMTMRAALFSHAPLFEDVAKINDTSMLNTKRPVLMVAIIRKKDLSRFPSYVHWSNTKLVDSYEEFLFYTSSIQPH